MLSEVQFSYRFKHPAFKALFFSMILWEKLILWEKSKQQTSSQASSDEFIQSLWSKVLFIQTNHTFFYTLRFIAERLNASNEVTKSHLTQALCALMVSYQSILETSSLHLKNPATILIFNIFSVLQFAGFSFNFYNLSHGKEQPIRIALFENLSKKLNAQQTMRYDLGHLFSQIQCIENENIFLFGKSATEEKIVCFSFTGPDTFPKQQNTLIEEKIDCFELFYYISKTYFLVTVSKQQLRVYVLELNCRTKVVISGLSQVKISALKESGEQYDKQVNHYEPERD